VQVRASHTDAVVLHRERHLPGLQLERVDIDASRTAFLVLRAVNVIDTKEKGGGGQARARENSRDFSIKKNAFSACATDERVRRRERKARAISRNGDRELSRGCVLVQELRESAEGPDV
jgi:hypothetical protein